MLTIEIEESPDLKGHWGLQLQREVISKTVFALNKTARKAVEQVKADLPDKFTLRGGWVGKGIRFDSADRDSMEARVYSIDPWMVKQEEGESYKPDGHVAIPSAARPSPKARIPRNLLPNALRGRSDVFKFDFSKKASYKPYPLVGIFQRTNNGKFFRVLYLLKDIKNTKPLWHFSEKIDDTVDDYFDIYFNEDDPDDYTREKPGSYFRP